MASIYIASAAIDMSGMAPIPNGMTLAAHTASQYGFHNGTIYVVFAGSFQYDPDMGSLVGGIITGIVGGTFGQHFDFNVTDLSLEVSTVLTHLSAGNPYAVLPAAVNGDDRLFGEISGATLWGGPGNDVLMSDARPYRSETLLGGEGNDTLIGHGGDILDGGPGLDTAKFNPFTMEGGSLYIQSVAPGTVEIFDWHTTSMLTLLNVERATFGNVNFAFDIDGHAGQAYRLYQAAFDRKPDLGGMGFQMNALDTGLTLSQVAANFIASPEFQAKYGAVDNTQFIALLYQHVLHRAPDDDGLQWHLSELEHGYSRADVLTFFSESPENQANVIGDISAGIQYTDG